MFCDELIGAFYGGSVLKESGINKEKSSYTIFDRIDSMPKLLSEWITATR